MKRSGFTLIELILVIAILAILIGIVTFAVNPGKNLASSRNAQRRSDIKTVVDAVYQYSVDNGGSLPTAITTTPTDICVTGGTCTGLIDLSVLTLNEKYLVSLPKDPKTATANDTRYQISKSVNGRVTVTAVDAENSETITTTR